MSAVVLDNEAVQALTAPHHPKHRRVVAHLLALIARRRRGAQVSAIVPTAVRVEAGWDRTEPRAAAVNRLRIDDQVLDRTTANRAAAIVSTHGVSVADAHLGAVVATLPEAETVVLTSDPDDVARVSEGRTVRVVRL